MTRKARSVGSQSQMSPLLDQVLPLRLPHSPPSTRSSAAAAAPFMVRGMRRTIDERAFLFSSTVTGMAADLHPAAPRADDQFGVEDVLRVMTVWGANCCTTSRRSTFMPWVSSMRAVEEHPQDGGEALGDQVADGRALVLRALHELAAHHDAGAGCRPADRRPSSMKATSWKSMSKLTMKSPRPASMPVFMAEP